MATSAARIRSLYRRHHQAHEAVYHFSACSPDGAAVNSSVPRCTGTSPSLSADERFRAALRREMARPAFPDSPFAPLLKSTQGD